MKFVLKILIPFSTRHTEEGLLSGFMTKDFRLDDNEDNDDDKEDGNDQEIVGADIII